MSTERLDCQTREASWRRRLTPEERSQLDARLAAASPDARREWESELALTRALGSVPDVPVASNFTARVLAEARREAQRPRVSGLTALFGRLRSVLVQPRVAFAALLVVAGLFSYRYVQDTRQLRMVEGVSVVSRIGSLPSPEVLRDFDAIHAFAPAPAADEELIALLK